MTSSSFPSFYDQEMDRNRPGSNLHQPELYIETSERITDECCFHFHLTFFVSDSFINRLEKERVKKWLTYFHAQMSDVRTQIDICESKIKCNKRDQLDIESHLERYIYKNGPIRPGEYTSYINTLYLRYENKETEMAQMTNDLDFLYTKTRDLKVVIDRLTKVNCDELPKEEMKNLISYVEKKSELNNKNKHAFRRVMTSAYNIDKVDPGHYNERDVLEDSALLKVAPTLTSSSIAQSSFDNVLQKMQNRMYNNTHAPDMQRNNANIRVITGNLTNSQYTNANVPLSSSSSSSTTGTGTATATAARVAEDSANNTAHDIANPGTQNLS